MAPFLKSFLRKLGCILIKINGGDSHRLGSIIATILNEDIHMLQNFGIQDASQLPMPQQAKDAITGVISLFIGENTTDFIRGFLGFFPSP